MICTEAVYREVMAASSAFPFRTGYVKLVITTGVTGQPAVCEFVVIIEFRSANTVAGPGSGETMPWLESTNGLGSSVGAAQLVVACRISEYYTLVSVKVILIMYVKSKGLSML